MHLNLQRISELREKRKIKLRPEEELKIQGYVWYMCVRDIFYFTENKSNNDVDSIDEINPH